MQQQENERAIKIKVALMRKGLTQRDIAKELGISNQMVNFCIHGKRTSSKFDSWIDKNLKETEKEVAPV